MVRCLLFFFFFFPPPPSTLLHSPLFSSSPETYMYNEIWKVIFVLLYLQYLIFLQVLEMFLLNQRLFIRLWCENVMPPPPCPSSAIRATISIELSCDGEYWGGEGECWMVGDGDAPPIDYPPYPLPDTTKPPLLLLYLQ